MYMANHSSSNTWPAWFLLSLIFGLLPGCIGAVNTGTIYSLDDGAMFPVEVRKDVIDGTIRFTNLKTGEFFSGTYSKAGGSATDVQAMTSVAANPNLQAVGADTVAILTGNRGTVLNCTLSLQDGYGHHGMGNCADKAGNSYRLNF
jgi:hypothetical protein